MTAFLIRLLDVGGTAGFFYIIGAFVAWNTDPSEWGVLLRLGVVLSFTSFVIYASLIGRRSAAIGGPDKPGGG